MARAPPRQLPLSSPHPPSPAFTPSCVSLALTPRGGSHPPCPVLTCSPEAHHTGSPSPAARGTGPSHTPVSFCPEEDSFLGFVPLTVSEALGLALMSLNGAASYSGHACSHGLGSLWSVASRALRAVPELSAELSLTMVPAAGSSYHRLTEGLRSQVALPATGPREASRGHPSPSRGSTLRFPGQLGSSFHGP